MDYPYTTISARDGDALINITVHVASETAAVGETDIVSLVREHLATLPGLSTPTAIRRDITVASV